MAGGSKVGFGECCAMSIFMFAWGYWCWLVDLAVSPTSKLSRQISLGHSLPSTLSRSYRACIVFAGKSLQSVPTCYHFQAH